MTERVVLYNPIGVIDARLGRRAPELNEIKKQTLAFGGDEDLLAGSTSVLQERMKFIAAAVPRF